jgi:hypothetical protein
MVECVMRPLVSVIAGGVLLLAGPPIRPDLDAWSNQRDAGAEAQRLIEMAHAWLGGSDRIAGVPSLELVGRTETHRVLFPDRYQIDRATPAGRTLISFDGLTIRSRPPGPVGDADRMRGLRNVAIYAIQYLVRVLPTYPMDVRVDQEAACAGIPGACLQFAPKDDAPIGLVVDPASGQPRATVMRTTLSTPGGRERHDVLSVNLLDDYRLVDGLRMPFRIERQFVRLDLSASETIATQIHEAVRINPALTESDFNLPDP